MRIHLIAVGGSAMHNLAIALHKKGFNITGSDDFIRNPSKDRLAKHNLLPQNGWFPKNITNDINIIILGMHAKEDNPELIEAKKLGLKIYSYPEYLYEQSKNKKRIVVGGSHGKTTITAMILHVLKNLNIKCDFMIGAQIEGINTMVNLSNDSNIMLLEGDEYLSSAIDKRPKFHLYKPHIGVITGIAWDHINVFPTFEIYKEQFRIFSKMVKESLIFFSEDKELQKIIDETRKNKKSIAYSTPKFTIKNNQTIIAGRKLKIFGKHNLQNLVAARIVCNEIGIEDNVFFNEIKSFTGANNRLELISKNKTCSLYKDFAHSPSKLKATIEAMKLQFVNKKLTACMELHTFSSLNINFINEYKDSMNQADEAIVYINPETIKNKELKQISSEMICKAFNCKEIKVFNNSKELQKYLLSKEWNNHNLLMMSSGNFNNLDLTDIFKLKK